MGLEVIGDGGVANRSVPEKTDLGLADCGNGPSRHNWAVRESFDLVHNEIEYAVAAGVTAVS